MRVALAQTDCALGEVDENVAAAEDQIKQAAAQGADLVVFPELSLHGYHLGDLKQDASVPAQDPRLLALSTLGADVVVGLHEHTSLRAYNTSAYYSDGQLLHAHRKLYLPNYLAWEERKHVSPGQHLRAYDLPGGHGRAATLVCNDAWQPVLPWLAVQDGAEVILVPANSAASLDPEAMDTGLYWDSLLSYTARMLQCWVVFVNRVGNVERRDVLGRLPCRRSARHGGGAGAEVGAGACDGRHRRARSPASAAVGPLGRGGEAWPDRP